MFCGIVLQSFIQFDRGPKSHMIYAGFFGKKNFIVSVFPPTPINLYKQCFENAALLFLKDIVWVFGLLITNLTSKCILIKCQLSTNCQHFYLVHNIKLFGSLNTNLWSKFVFELLAVVSERSKFIKKIVEVCFRAKINFWLQIREQRPKQSVQNSQK